MSSEIWRDLPCTARLFYGIARQPHSEDLDLAWRCASARRLHGSRRRWRQSDPALHGRVACTRRYIPMTYSGTALLRNLGNSTQPRKG
eukprot:394478-Pleurochrysis_carterae.AAC.1